MIDLNPDDLALVRKLLAEHVPDCAVRVYGSRVRSTAHPDSDLDLAIVGPGPLDPGRLEALRAALSESNLPMLVDVQDWYRISPAFQAVIGRGFETLR